MRRCETLDGFKLRQDAVMVLMLAGAGQVSGETEHLRPMVHPPISDPILLWAENGKHPVKRGETIRVR
jgi:hypothetical protein